MKAVDADISDDRRDADLIDRDFRRLRREVSARMIFRRGDQRMKVGPAGAKRAIAQRFLHGLCERFGSYRRASKMLHRKGIQIIVQIDKVEDWWGLNRKGANHEGVTVTPSVIDDVVDRWFGEGAS